jgi:hypothetical protein
MKFRVVLINICFMDKEVKHFFMYWLGICSSFFKTLYSSSCAHCFIGLMLLGGWVFWVLYRFWIIVPYQMNS